MNPNFESKASQSVNQLEIHLAFILKKSFFNEFALIWSQIVTAELSPGQMQMINNPVNCLQTFPNDKQWLE